jgi:hypothetical protein
LESQLVGEVPGAPPGIPRQVDGAGAPGDTSSGAGTGPPDGSLPVEATGLGARTRRGTRPIPLWKLAGHRLDGGRSAGLRRSRGAGGAEAVTGESLRARRESLGISQAAVAHAAHCSRGLVAEVERGKRRASQTLAHLDATLDKLEQQLRRP